MFESFFHENYEKAHADKSLLHDLLETISRAVNMIEYKDAHHSDRVALNSLRLARELGIGDEHDLAQLYIAGLLHDVGEVGIPDNLLYQKGKLSEEEFQLLTTHTTVGQQIVSQVPLLQTAADLILWHHERWDGTGYPDGLTVEETPVLAQVLSLCDAFDNICRGGLFSTPENWEQELIRFSAIQFNPLLVPPLIRLTKSGRTDDIQRSPEDDAVILALEKEERLMGVLRRDYVASIINFLLTLLEAKHKESAIHSKRVARLCGKIGERMGLSELDLETVVIAGNLHDIGKVGIPNSILDKPGMLDDWEYQIVQKHPRHAAAILEPLQGFGKVAETVRYHHERWDGSGYPEGLAGEEIPPLARILHLCDLADALTHLRQVPARMDAGPLRFVIEDGYGSYFDPDLSLFFAAETAEAEELEDQL